MKYLCLLFLVCTTETVWAGDLKLEIQGAGLAEKTIYAAVYAEDHAQDFPMRDQFARIGNVKATGDVVEILMHDFAEGEYAVAVFEDVNGNGKLDTNFLGIPKEPVGVSRNAKGKFGPPKFVDAGFKIGDGITPMRIQLH
jgi:uncharacterized protein (DUF2141 family)